MQRVLRTFQHFDEADEADWEYYASLTPQERLKLLLEIIDQARETSGEASEGLERVYQVIELSED